MDTKIVKINPDNIDEKIMQDMGKIISDGGLVAFPTETVYGLGANAFSADSVVKIFNAKGRPSDNPLIVHVSSFDEVKEVAREIPDAARLVFDAFSPGPITLILKKAAFVPSAVTAGLDTVAVRIPSHKIARELIKKAGVPIAAPSANRSGKPSPTMAEHVIADMNGRIDAIIDGGSCSVGVESTILDMTLKHPTILRPGDVTYEELKKLLPDALIDDHVLKAASVNAAPKCPGMKYKHYAPDAELFVVEGRHEAVAKKINSLIAENPDKKVGVLALGDKKYNADLVINAGSDNREYAKLLFAALREFDKNGIDIIFAEFVIDDEYALTVKNRIYKSAANKIIKAD